MVRPSPSVDLKLILVIMAYGSYRWTGVAAGRSCYVCTDKLPGCISTNPSVLEKYKKTCINNSFQCVVTLGQRNSALYNGTSTLVRPAEESELNRLIEGALGR